MTKTELIGEYLQTDGWHPAATFTNAAEAAAWRERVDESQGHRRVCGDLSAKRRAASKARKTFGAGPGRPRSPDRCPCGAMTARRAALRRHICSPT